jgi:hypothetical protein
LVVEKKSYAAGGGREKRLNDETTLLACGFSPQRANVTCRRTTCMAKTRIASAVAAASWQITQFFVSLAEASGWKWTACAVEDMSTSRTARKITHLEKREHPANRGLAVFKALPRLR